MRFSWKQGKRFTLLFRDLKRHHIDISRKDIPSLYYYAKVTRSKSWSRYFLDMETLMNFTRNVPIELDPSYHNDNNVKRLIKLSPNLVKFKVLMVYGIPCLQTIPYLSIN